MNPRVALRLQQLGDLLLGEILRHVHGEGDDEARISRRRGALGHLGEDRLGRVAPHRRGAALAEELRDAGEKQLQVIVDLRHRPDGGARGAHRIRLVDGDRGRNAFDGIDLRLVHAVEELARVRRECLDVAPLAFRVERVEHERGLARSRRARDDDQLARGQIDVEVLEVVLARAANADHVLGLAVEGCGIGGVPRGEVVHGNPGKARRKNQRDKWKEAPILGTSPTGPAGNIFRRRRCG